MKKYDEDLKSFFDKVYGEKLHKFSKDKTPEMRMKPSWYMYRLLCEAYVESSNNVDLFEVLKKIQDANYKRTTFDELFSYLDSYDLLIDFVDGDNVIGGDFSISARKIVLKMSDDIYQRVVNGDDEDLKDLAENFWVSFVHEDTHKQQQKAAGNYDIRTNYKSMKSSFWKDDFSQDLDYFDQYSEADAYGREIGAALQKVYKGRSTSTIFSYINRNTVGDDYCRKIINTYKDPRVSDRNRRKFFRALYDFLAGNEKDEEC